MPFDPWHPENIVEHWSGGGPLSPNLAAFRARISALPRGIVGTRSTDGSFGAGGSTLPGLTQSGSGAFGAVPQVPNPITTASQAITGNLGNLAGILQIVNSANPLLGQQRTVTGDLLSGKLPADVVTQLQQRAAERGVATGSPGSPNVDAAYLRALGLTSLDLTGRGMDYASRLGQETFGMERPFFVLPEDMQAAQLAANIYAAAPNPALAAAEARRAVQPVGGSTAPRYGGTPTIYQPPSFSTARPKSPGSDASYSLPTLAYGGWGTGASNPMNFASGDAYENWYNTISAVPQSALQTAGPVNPDWFYGADTGYNYADMHESLGLPYTDWNAIGGGSDIGQDWEWSDFE